MNVGLVTVVLTPSASQRYFVNVVFPAPSSPSRIIFSPPFNSFARLYANLRIPFIPTILLLFLLSTFSSISNNLFTVLYITNATNAFNTPLNRLKGNTPPNIKSLYILSTVAFFLIFFGITLINVEALPLKSTLM